MSELTIRPGSYVGPQFTIYDDGVIVASTWTREDAEKIVAALQAERSAGDATLREALEAAYTDLVGCEGFFERAGSMGTVTSIRRTLAKIDAALDVRPATAPTPGVDPADPTR